MGQICNKTRSFSIVPEERKKKSERKRKKGENLK
jgi:hypothetical protein